jgi:hypothetical protein
MLGPATFSYFAARFFARFIGFARADTLLTPADFASGASAARMLAGISRHPQAFACAKCHRTRSATFAPRGIRCASCQRAFMAMVFIP